MTEVRKKPLRSSFPLLRARPKAGRLETMPPTKTIPTLRIALTGLLALLLAAPAEASELYAHRSGCHRWHSCPPDRGTYICGDTGHCSQCPDNQFCEGGRPRRALTPRFRVSPKPSPPRFGLPVAPRVVQVIDGDTLRLPSGERVLAEQKLDAEEKKLEVGISTNFQVLEVPLYFLHVKTDGL